MDDRNKEEWGEGEAAMNPMEITAKPHKLQNPENPTR